MNKQELKTIEEMAYERCSISELMELMIAREYDVNPPNLEMLLLVPIKWLKEIGKF